MTVQILEADCIQELSVTVKLAYQTALVKLNGQLGWRISIATATNKPNQYKKIQRWANAHLFLFGSVGLIAYICIKQKRDKYGAASNTNN